MRRTALLALLLFGLVAAPAAGHAATRLPQGNSPIVLVYHGIGPRRPFWVTPRELEGDIAFLRDHGYHFVSLSAFAAYEEQGQALPRHAVLLTFDDGVASVFRYALPLTERLRIPAVAFVIGRRIGLRGYMTAAELRALYASGLWSIEAHTYDMHSYREGRLGYAPDLVNPRTGASPQAFAREIARDVQAEARFFRSAGLPQPTAFAFPFGIYGPEAVAVLHRTYPLLFDSTPELAAPHEAVIGRVDATGDPLGVILSRYAPKP